VRATLEVIAWWPCLTGLWLLTLSSVSIPELLAAAVAGLICGLAARAARRAMGGAWRLRMGWIRWLASVPRALARESAQVLLARHAGRIDEVSLPDEPEAVRAARSAVATVLVGSTPGTMVVSAGRRLVVHRLLEDDSPLLGQVQR
jgi:multisubunit Na+/H+ antiporter MnhE subunit